MANPTPGDVIVIAHRGCWNAAPENSIASVEACIALGADGVELDIRHTRDGVAVVIHDETVDRTTDGHGRVADLTLAEIKALRLRQGKGGPSQPLTTQTIPTLEEYLTATAGRLWLVFDVKDKSEGRSFDIARSIGLQDQAIFFYECRNTDLLDRIRPFWDQVVVFPIAFSTDGPLSGSITRCPSRPGNLIHTKWTDAGFLEEATDVITTRNQRVWIATMNSRDVAGHDDASSLIDPDSGWGRQIEAGANMIMTDEPDALVAYLSTR